MEKVIIIGGGIAGLTAGVQLARAGIQCLIIEKKKYPFHRVCGEYVSNEAVPFLKSLGLYPQHLDPPQICRFLLSSTNGKSETLPLDTGGFGISRFAFDSFLFSKAKDYGVEFLLETEVESVDFFSHSFKVSTSKEILEGDFVLGAFGKRSKLDVHLKRAFVQSRSPFVAVKYHIRTQHPSDLIALHNFNGGYCGISNVEDGKTNLCYLTHRKNLKVFKDIREMEKHILFQNPLLKNIFTHSDFLFPKPEVINEISFTTKQPVEDHMLMMGDSAGMITPLCGNGMAMAIHSAKLAAELIISSVSQRHFSREMMEKTYASQWRKLFTKRLWAGRQIQKLFGSNIASQLAVNLALHVKPVAKLIIRNTHGDPF